MPRANTLKKLEKRLVLRRAELLKSLREELADLGAPGHAGPADPGDAAFDSYTDEVSSQLAELGSAELTQIEDSLERIKEGRYGRCEACGGRIPAARLNALPFTSTCVRCQREQELGGTARSGAADGPWQKVYDSERNMDEREPDISAMGSDLGMDLSRGR